MSITTSRWVVLSTLFSISEACLYGLLVDLLDAHKLPHVMNYRDLYLQVRDTLDTIHAHGELKAEVIAHPEKYIADRPRFGAHAAPSKIGAKRTAF